MRLARQNEDWTLGFVDEVWWSRFAQPQIRAWAPKGEPLRLVAREPNTNEEDPKALACYGAYMPMKATGKQAATGEAEPGDESDMLLRFVEGRPVSEAKTTFLEWVCERLAERSARVWALIWDQVSWHTSGDVQDWIQENNRQVKREGGVRILACQLPLKSPWLNPIEPKWLHGKRAICEPNGTLTPEDVVERMHAYYDCMRVEPMYARRADTQRDRLRPH